MVAWCASAVRSVCHARGDNKLNRWVSNLDFIDVAAVPEAPTWVMMLAGFAGLGLGVPGLARAPGGLKSASGARRESAGLGPRQSTLRRMTVPQPRRRAPPRFPADRAGRNRLRGCHRDPCRGSFRRLREDGRLRFGQGCRVSSRLRRSARHSVDQIDGHQAVQKRRWLGP